MRYVNLSIFILLSMISVSCVNDYDLGEDLEALQYAQNDTTDSVPYNDSNLSTNISEDTVTYWEPPTVSIYNNIGGYDIVQIAVMLYRNGQQIGTITDGGIFNDVGELGHVGNENLILRSCRNDEYCNTVQWNDSIPMSWITYPDYVALDYTIRSCDASGEEIPVHTEESLIPQLFYNQKEWTIRFTAFGKGISCNAGSIIIKSNLNTISFDTVVSDYE